MNLRFALYEQAARHRLDGRALATLLQLAGLRGEPDHAARRLAHAIAIAGAAIAGLGLIFVVAANWDAMGRYSRLGLVQALFLASCLGALRWPALRTPFALLALLATGALWACFSQTYPSGANAWQLFALWAALALPLCLGARSDAVWVAWSLVAVTALRLWTHTDTWRQQPAHVAVWLGATAQLALFSAAARPFTGAGVWAQRMAALQLCAFLSWDAVIALFSNDGVAPEYLFAVLWLLALIGLSTRPRATDLPAACLYALGLNLALDAGMARLFLGVGLLPGAFLLACGACALLAVSVWLLLNLTPRPAGQGGRP